MTDGGDRPELEVAASHPPVPYDVSTGRLILISIVGLALSLHLVGLQRDLPFTPEIDEPQLVNRAVNIAATGDFNPGWFGHPGSTMIYPLAVIYHAWNGVVHSGKLLGADTSLEATFASNGSEFYLLGRLLATFYAVATVPLIYLIGRRVFRQRTGLIAAGLFALYPVAVTHAQMVRTDAAAAFFGALGLWLCLRLYDRPTMRNRILAGIAIGLAISTRYFMATLLPILVAVEILVLWRQIRDREATRLSWLQAGLGPAAAAVAFALTTPYFFLDNSDAWASVKHEARGTHLGADGFSRSENLVWYLTDAIPESITWIQVCLAALGAGVIIWSRQPRRLLPLGLVVVFLPAISVSRLHWQRWLIPVLPLFALLAAHGLDVVVEWLSRQARLMPVAARGLVVLAIVLVAAWPAYDLILQDVRQATPSTRILAREWLLLNLPAGSRIAMEAYTAPLGSSPFAISQSFALGRRPMQAYTDEDYEYIVVSEEIWGRFFGERGRYENEVVFYETLFSDADLLQKFEPSNTRGGSEIRVYSIGDLTEAEEEP